MNIAKPTDRLEAGLTGQKRPDLPHALQSVNPMKLLDVVAPLESIPAAHLAKGQVGAIVEELNEDVVLIEFADLNEVAYAIEPIPACKLMELPHTPAMAA